jgi:tetrahydromethanopterin S-methyltransferase subunit B
MTDEVGTAKVDLEKYTELVLKVEEAEDKIREMEQLTNDLKKTTALAKPPERFSFGALFRDENDINEKSIIGFASFALMVAFGICDLIMGLSGKGLTISDTIYTSFVVVTLGSFGISEAGKAFGKH